MALLFCLSAQHFKKGNFCLFMKLLLSQPRIGSDTANSRLGKEYHANQGINQRNLPNGAMMFWFISKILET